jgi:hypothetical protein
MEQKYDVHSTEEHRAETPIMIYPTRISLLFADRAVLSPERVPFQ